MIFRKKFFLIIIFFLFGLTNAWSSEKIAFLDVEFIINKSETALVIIKKIEKIRDQETEKLSKIYRNFLLTIGKIGKSKIREKKYYVHADNNLQNLIKSI